MICAVFAFGKGSLKGVSYIFINHEGHKTKIKDTGEDLAKATGDRYGPIIGRIIFCPFLVKGGDVGLFPWG